VVETQTAPMTSHWFRFVEAPAQAGRPRKTNRWNVVGADAGHRESIVIGWVSWFARWRRYAFFPVAGTVYDPDCLRDLATFCEERTAERKAVASGEK
jgi:hypothetical protein